jgi:hypothetical protein
MPFKKREINEDGLKLIGDFTEQLQDIYTGLSGALSPTRERALAITALQEATMWINKAISIQFEK